MFEEGGAELLLQIATSGLAVVRLVMPDTLQEVELTTRAQVRALIERLQDVLFTGWVRFEGDGTLLETPPVDDTFIPASAGKDVFRFDMEEVKS